MEVNQSSGGVGPDILLPMLDEHQTDVGQQGVALVDVEQLFGPRLERPELLPGGSPGYAHRVAPKGLWQSTADRFAGAVLLAEMLGWCDKRIRQAAWGESYFDPAEMQQDSSTRYELLVTVLRDQWGGGVARLLEQAWDSATLEECPTFGEWVVSLPIAPPAVSTMTLLGASDVQDTLAHNVALGGGSPDSTEQTVRALMELAARFTAQGKIDSAIEVYREALFMVPADSEIERELAVRLSELTDRPEPVQLDSAQADRVVMPASLVVDTPAAITATTAVSRHGTETVAMPVVVPAPGAVMTLPDEPVAELGPPESRVVPAGSWLRGGTGRFVVAGIVGLVAIGAIWSGLGLASAGGGGSPIATAVPAATVGKISATEAPANTREATGTATLVPTATMTQEANPTATSAATEVPTATAAVIVPPAPATLTPIPQPTNTTRPVLTNTPRPQQPTLTRTPTARRPTNTAVPTRAIRQIGAVRQIRGSC